MNFAKPVDRKETYSYKWEKYRGKDILPMWVADSEFECAEPIKHAVHQRVEHGVFGYHLPTQYEPANRAVQRWLADKHDWHIESDWIVWIPGVVPGFNVASKAVCEAGDRVLVQTPNYPPLLASPRINGLEGINIPTVMQDGRYTLDFDRLEEEAKHPNTKLMILCNPMNPVGSVLTESEIERVRDICVTHNVVLCSDEIHCDLILDENAKHIPAGRVPELSNRSVTLMAASKTFNIAGLGTAFAIIPDKTLRRRFSQAALGHLPWVTILGLVATEAALTECDDWHAAQIDYLRANRDYLCEQINQLPGLSVIPSEATFLAWVDASGLGVDNPMQYFEELGVGPSPGADFGDKQCVRLNFACPRTDLEEAVRRLSKGRE
ncbi:PatB family C-S lyase [Aestuariibacter sp. AA17]|uniref:cysteine-S-conjugate beta-lyase n=1 Tax=Fluctibacter corallii TaxID=2984329 RepID=A0ABT3ACM4_9ALTE|nr:PatB family C-S lyase [Aestuariibacter sp. AA17]MCV2886433.1 PatB family C-S lyase [Aestuariibacter sp. AA17]